MLVLQEGEVFDVHRRSEENEEAAAHERPPERLKLAWRSWH